MSNKEFFKHRFGSLDHVNSVLDAAPYQKISTLKEVAKNPVLGREQHQKLMEIENPSVDYALATHQKHLDSDLVTDIARKNGTYVARAITAHPNATSQSIQHVLDDLVGGGDDSDYENSNVVRGWKAKRDELKAQGK